MRNTLIIIALTVCQAGYGQNLPLLKISSDRNYIVTEQNEPFFWLGGTAWELIHRLNREEIDRYLSDRADKGFTVIQTVILAELDGLNTPNAYGDKPLINNDPGRLNEKYFEHVDYVIDKADKLGLYIGLLPTWGDKFNLKWGTGPEIFDPVHARVYGKLLAERYAGRKNIIWILGGDRAPENELHYAIIRAMADGIRSHDTLHLITYHPVGAKRAADFFDNESWLDIDMFQSGHSSLSKEYSYVADSRLSSVRRPVINGEARYENIPDRFWEERSPGWLDDADVRVSAYWSILAGAAGYTYGCNDIWQMWDVGREPVISARTGWQAALNLPGSSQMKYMRSFFEMLPWQKMAPDQSIILNDNPENETYIMSVTGLDRKFAVVYTPTGKPINLDLSKIDAEIVKAYWFNPRSGGVKYIGDFPAEGPREFKPWAEGRGSDFLLIVMSNDLPYNFDLLNN